MAVGRGVTLEKPRRRPNNRMNPTGLIGPRSIGIPASAVGLVVEQVLHESARRVMRMPLGGQGLQTFRSSPVSSQNGKAILHG